MPFQFQQLAIPEVILVEALQRGDHRGYLIESYKRSEFADNGIPDRFVQDNISYSVQGVLRGLHYQKAPHAQAKLVMVLEGEIFDVAVDIRQGSPTYGQWIGITLTAAQPRMLYIPEGFAHGFCVVSETARFMYKISSEYAPDYDRGIAWNDPAVGIDWPIHTPRLSERDASLPPLHKADNNFVYAGASSYEKKVPEERIVWKNRISNIRP